MVLLERVCCIKKSLIRGFNPARGRVVQGVVTAGKQTKKVFLHLHRCVRDCKSRNVLPSPLDVSIIVFQRRGTVFSEFRAFRAMEDLHVTLTGCKAEVVVQRIYGLLDGLLLHCFKRYGKQLPCSRNIRSIRHISGQLCGALTAVGKQQNLASFVRKPVRILFLSRHRRLQLKLRPDQVEEGLISSGAERGKLRGGKQVPAVRTGWKGENLRLSLHRVVAEV